MTTTETKLFRARIIRAQWGMLIGDEGVAREMENGQVEFMPDYRLFGSRLVDACDIERIG